MAAFHSKSYSEALAKRQERPAKPRKPLTRTSFKPHRALEASGTTNGTDQELRTAQGLSTAIATPRRGTFRRTRTARQKIGDALDAQWRTSVRERDNYTCQWPGCNYSSRHIHAHHINTRKQRPDQRRVVKNGICLCQRHHNFLHHTVEGRAFGRKHGLLGTETYELAKSRGRQSE